MKKLLFVLASALAFPVLAAYNPNLPITETNRTPVAAVIASVAGVPQSSNSDCQGNALPVNTSSTLSYTSGNLTSITLTSNPAGSTWISTLAYSGSNLSSVSCYAKQ